MTADHRDPRPAPDASARRGKADVEAVRGVDLAVEAGEIFGFLGPNGAGKTTTLRMLATLLPPTRRHGTVAGADLAREPGKVRAAHRLRRRRAARPTRPRPAAASSIIQGRLYGMDNGEPRRRGAAEVLEALDLDAAADRPTEHLLRRHASTPGRRARDRPPAVRAVPRRADHRPRPPGARPACGTRSAACATAARPCS